MRKPETDAEILEFAIWKERQAARLFDALAERVSDPDVAQLLESLATEERNHMEKLELEVLKTGRTVQSPEEGADEPEVLITGDIKLNMSIKDILTLAVEKEDSSFRLYLGLIPQIQDSDAREVLVSLAQEEVRHKILFESELDKLTSQKD